DWGWAPEYVEAMWRIMQYDKPDDFVIATGHAASLREFTESAFKHLGLNAWDHIDLASELRRPTDIGFGKGNPAKAREHLRWRAEKTMGDVTRLMVDAELDRLKKPSVQV